MEIEWLLYCSPLHPYTIAIEDIRCIYGESAKESTLISMSKYFCDIHLRVGFLCVSLFSVLCVSFQLLTHRAAVVSLVLPLASIHLLHFCVDGLLCRCCTRPKCGTTYTKQYFIWCLRILRTCISRSMRLSIYFSLSPPPFSVTHQIQTPFSLTLTVSLYFIPCTEYGRFHSNSHSHYVWSFSLSYSQCYSIPSQNELNVLLLYTLLRSV